MFNYSKLGQAGIAAVSYLAEIHGENRLAGSAEIAEVRGLSRPLVAKILTHLSAAGLVAGKSGPTGGYQLSRVPAKISLLDVVRLFDNVEGIVMCPFGPNWCGIREKCPLHDQLFRMRDAVRAGLQRETFAQFGKPERRVIRRKNEIIK